MSNYSNGVGTISTTAAILCNTAGAGSGIAVVQNDGPATVYIGGPNVSADNSPTGGIAVSSGATQNVPTISGEQCNLWAITASGTAKLRWLLPVWI